MYLWQRFCSIPYPFIGTPIHIDPSATDAFNALFVGHKWWVILPKDLYEFNAELSCDKKCSDYTNFGPCHTCENAEIDNDISNILWFKHILPQIRCVFRINIWGLSGKN